MVNKRITTDISSGLDLEKKIKEYQEGVDYVVGKGGDKYIVVSERLKKVVWPNEDYHYYDEAMVIVDRKGIITRHSFLTSKANLGNSNLLEWFFEKDDIKERKVEENYCNWTREQLITEINCLKTEIEELKNNQTLSNSEKQTKLQENKKNLEKLTSYYNADSSQLNNSYNNFPVVLIISGIAFLVMSLILLLIFMGRHRK